jgi:uncharacterized membrane protein YhhN
MFSHWLFNLPVMMLGAVLGVMVDVALVQHFQLPKEVGLVGVVPSSLLGAFLTFWICHFVFEGICAILRPVEEHFLHKKSSRRDKN